MLRFKIPQCNRCGEMATRRNMGVPYILHSPSPRLAWKEAEVPREKGKKVRRKKKKKKKNKTNKKNKKRRRITGACVIQHFYCIFLAIYSVPGRGDKLCCHHYPTGSI